MARKNILLVSFDDAVAPWPYHSIFGEPLRTPNLDAFGRTATQFRAAYAQAPICGPSRASMMTSRMPPELGITDNSIFLFHRHGPGTVWSQRLKEAGWFCSSGGKVHHRYKPLPEAEHGALYSDGRKHFQADMGLERPVRKRAVKFGGNRNGRGTEDGTDDHTYFDHQAADSAIDFLATHDSDQPFYREVGFYSPHVPHLTPARFKRMYDAAALKRPESWRGHQPDNAYAAGIYPPDPAMADEDWWQKCVRNYFSAYSHGDHHFGRVIAALKASRHAANTVVVVVSDHGFHLGNRGLFRKSTLWEQSLRVPFLIFDPDDPVGRQVDDPVGLIDLGPTVLDYAGLDCEWPDQSFRDGADPAHAGRVPAGEGQAGAGPGAGPGPKGRGGAARGRSLRGLAERPDPERVIPSFFRGNVSIRKGDYRIIRYADGSHQLFDVIRDFWQLQDLGTGHPMFVPMAQALLDCSVACGFDFRDLPLASLPGALDDDEDAGDA